MADTTTAYTASTAAGTAALLLRAMRPKQWPKNAFVFAALVFDRKLLDLPLFGRTLIAFLLFCLVSGAVYLINDLVDVEKDRQHPHKRHRPLASGQLRPGVAIAAAVTIVIVGLPLGFVLGIPFGVVLSSYFLLQTLYSFALKHLVIIDALTVAAGFVLRAVGGAAVIGVMMSPWLYICTTLLALFISFGRRRHELMLLEAEAANHRAILDQYSPHLLDHLITIVAATTIIAYSLYTFSAPNLPANHAMMLTIPFVLYGIFRYMYLIHIHNEGGSPEEMIFKDLPMLIDLGLWSLAVIVILYFM